MTRDQEYHNKIRDAVMSESMRLAREAWPAATERVHIQLATRAVLSAMLALDPTGNYIASQS